MRYVTRLKGQMVKRSRWQA